MPNAPKQFLRQEDLPDLMTTTEAAAYVRRCCATIRRWAKTDPHFPKLQEGLNGPLLIFRDEFIAWLKAKTHATRQKTRAHRGERG